MKRLLLTLFVALATLFSAVAKDYFGPEVMQSGGKERKFIYYLPKTAQSGDKLPVILFIHGIGAYNTSFYTAQAQKWADNHHCAVIVPQALPEQDQTLLTLLSAVNPNFANELRKSAWNANAYIRISDLDTDTQNYIHANYPQYYDAGKIQINKDLNDVNFIKEAYEHLQDILSNEKGIDLDTQKTFVVGLSLGGCMSYNYAFSDVSIAKKLVAMSGFLSKGVSVPSTYNLPTLAFNSKTDDVVLYNGGLINRPAEELINEIVSRNTHSDPTVTIINQELSSTKRITVKDWTEAPEVIFYSINKASHTLDVDLKNMGVDIFSVIGDFLFGDPSAVNETEADKTLTLYPNPASDVLNINSATEFSSATITNLAGQTFQLPVTENKMDVTSLAKGLYIIDLVRENGTVEKAKFIKK